MAERVDSPEQAEFREHCRRWLNENRPAPPSFRLPLSAIVSSKETQERWGRGAHGSTYGGNPVACAAGLAVLETFRERASASGDVGQLDGPEFLANLLEWVLESYFDAFEGIELVLEEIDASSMAGNHGARTRFCRGS